MNKKPLIGVSICAVVLLVLGSLSNVVGIENKKSCNCSDPPCWPELSGTMGHNNWYVSTVKVTFNGTLNYISYRIDEGNWTVYTAPFALTTERIHLLEWTCDSDMSNISSVEIKIDMYPPIFSNFSSKRIGLFKWQYNVNVSDEFSGVHYVWFPYGINDSEPPYQSVRIGCKLLFRLISWYDALHGIYYRLNAWDNAGNCYQGPS